MTKKTQTLLTLTAGTMLSLGCAASGSASVESNRYPKATASATVDDDAHTEQTANRGPITEDMGYMYAYDYDNDGGYAKTPVWDGSSDDDSLDTRNKYAYKFDRNGDGNHARKRPPTPLEKAGKGLQTNDMDIAELTIPLELDPSLEMACKEAKPTFFFEYDSAKLPEQTESDFDNIVDCLQHESLEDTNIEVIGHADARGPKDYNRDLGRERAEAVAAELEDAGLRDERIEIISRGESKADAPNHWDDRRVVIRMR